MPDMDSANKALDDAVMVISDLLPSLAFEPGRKEAFQKAMRGDDSQLYVWERAALEWLAENAKNSTMNAWTADLLDQLEKRVPTPT